MSFGNFTAILIYFLLLTSVYSTIQYSCFMQE